MTLLYHRFMTPNWLRDNATFNCETEGNDVRLTIKADTRKYENIFKVPLLASGFVPRGEDLTVRMHVGVELPEPAAPNRDPMAYMMSDGDYAVGIQLRDPARDYQV